MAIASLHDTPSVDPIVAAAQGVCDDIMRIARENPSSLKFWRGNDTGRGEDGWQFQAPNGTWGVTVDPRPHRGRR